ncbi:MAG: hypothetical protein K2X11_15470 [Acetobacteraceae bacterium]|nr:hypothetical protein [Acetobacteraceae bacterium]
MATETREQMIAAIAEDLPGEEMRAMLERQELSELRRLRAEQLAAAEAIAREGQLAYEWADGFPA